MRDLITIQADEARIQVERDSGFDPETLARLESLRPEDVQDYLTPMVGWALVDAMSPSAWRALRAVLARRHREAVKAEPAVMPGGYYRNAPRFAVGWWDGFTEASFAEFYAESDARTWARLEAENLEAGEVRLRRIEDGSLIDKFTCEAR